MYTKMCCSTRVDCVATAHADSINVLSEVVVEVVHSERTRSGMHSAYTSRITQLCLTKSRIKECDLRFNDGFSANAK